MLRRSTSSWLQLSIALESYPEVLPCNSTTSSFCCGSQGTRKCCQDPKTFLSIGPAVSSADAVPATTETASAAAPSSTSSSTPESTSGASPSSSTTTLALEDAHHSNTGVQIGVGVGVSVGALSAILAVASLWYRQRNRTRSATEKGDDIPELPPLLSCNALNSKLFPAELDPEGEGLKGPAELDPKPSMPSRGPVELATSPAELPAEPVESQYDAEHDTKEGSAETTAVGSQNPSLKKDRHLFSCTSPTEPSALTNPISLHALEHPDLVETPQIVPQLQTPRPKSLRPGSSSADRASSPEPGQEPNVPPPPPPLLEAIPSTANTTSQSSPPRRRAPRLGKGVELEHPNKQGWSLEQEQVKALSPKKTPEDVVRPQTIAERRNVGSPNLNSASGPWFDAYDAKTEKTQL